MIEEQTVRARGCGMELGTASTGNQQVGIDFILLDGPNMGEHITWYGYFTEATFDRTVESLDHCGWIGPDLADPKGIDANEVQLVIIHEQDNQGEIRARVNWVNSPGGVVMKNKMNRDDAKSFAAQMKGRVLAARGGGGQRPTARKPSAPQPRAPESGGDHEPLGDDRDDIPF